MASKADSLISKSLFHESDDEEDRGDDCGISLEKLNIGPRKKLLVINLNGLLVRRIFRGNTASIPKSRRPDGIFGSQLGDGNIKTQVVVYLGFGSLEKKDKPIFLMELNKLWDNKKLTLPWPKGRYTSANTLLIDDTPYKSLLNPPNSAIFPYPYEVEDSNDTTLGPKGELRLYLEGLADVDDIPAYVKENPFGQPAITSKHPSWKFYSKIIQSLTNESSSGEKVQ